MATPSTRQAIVQAILKRRTSESFQREKKSMKGYVPSYLEGDEKCVVCGDKATGYHYKCITCEGCKGFFRRTVQKSLEGSYQCKHSSNCDINKVTRNQCQLCRYNKCIGVGMAKDLVLDEEKRLAKRKLIEQNRELRRHKELSQMMAQCGWRIERPTDEERRLIHDVTQAYFQANDIQNKAISPENNGLAVAEKFSKALTAAITNVVDFAKRIPLFVNQVSTEDQVLILKVCCMEVITLRCVTSYRSSTKQVTLFPTVDVTREQLRFTRLEPFSDSLFALAEHLHSMELTPVEIALLQATLILSGDRPGIAERVRLDHAQDTILRAFEHHLNEIWPHDPKYCPSLLMKLTDVRSVSTCLADTLMSMRMDDPQELGRLFFRIEPAPTIPNLPIPYQLLHPHQRFKSASIAEVPHNHSQTNGLHRTGMKSYSLPHLNGFKTNHGMMQHTEPSNSTFNKNSRLDELLNKRSDAVVSNHNHRINKSNEASTSTLLSQTLHTPTDCNTDKETSYYLSKRDGIQLSPGNGLKYKPLSPEYVKYEVYRNSHNKVFERMTKAVRTSSSLSDDTNRISKSLLNNPNHFNTTNNSHSVPSSPCKFNDNTLLIPPTSELLNPRIVEIPNGKIPNHRVHIMSPMRNKTQLQTVTNYNDFSQPNKRDSQIAEEDFRIHENGDVSSSRRLNESLRLGLPTILRYYADGLAVPPNHFPNSTNATVPVRGEVHSDFTNGHRKVELNGLSLLPRSHTQRDISKEYVNIENGKQRTNGVHVNGNNKRPISPSPMNPANGVKYTCKNGVIQLDEPLTDNVKKPKISDRNSDLHNGARLKINSGKADISHSINGFQKRPKSC